MIALFRQKTPANIVLLLIFGLLIKLPYLLHPVLLTHPADGKVFHLIASSFKGSNAIFSAGIIAFFLLYIQAIIINYVVNEYRMTARQTFLPGMAFMMITSLVPEWNYLSAALISATLVAWAFSKLFNLYNFDSANGKIFNIGLLLGISSFFYVPSVLFGVCIIIGFMILRPFRLNEILLFLLGITTPYYFFAAYLFLSGEHNWKAAIPEFSIHVPTKRPSYWLLAGIILIGTPFLMGGYYIQTHLRKMLIQARKNWSVLLLYLLLSIFIPFVNNSEIYANWILCAAPVAAFHACAYLYPPRRWVATIMFIIMLLFILFQQYGHHFFNFKSFRV